MAAERTPRSSQSMEKAFRMSTEKPVRAPRREQAAPPSRTKRTVAPVSDHETEPRKRKTKAKKPFRLVRLVFTVVVLGWFFGMGVLVGRGTAPVNFDIDGLRNQLVTASAVISERIAQIGGQDESVDFYDSLGQTITDTSIADPRSYRPEYSVAPAGNPTAGADPADHDPATGPDGEPLDALPGDEALLDTFEGKILEPQVKPKTEFDGYLALREAGVQTPSVPTPPPVATQQPTTPQVPDNRGASTVVSGREVPAGSFSVQVAAVRGENEAKAFLANLGQKGFSGRVEKTTVGEGVWYRVRVGVYQTRAQAEDDLQKLIKIGIKSPMIVTN